MVWVTMITPYTKAGGLDEGCISALVDWYAQNGVDGIFTTCQSSEVFHLTMEERILLRDTVLRAAVGRLPVIVSGITQLDIARQLQEIGIMADSAASCVVLFTNMLYAGGDDDAFLRNTDAILSAFPSVAFGLYECPYPQKRLISDRCLSYCASTGRFFYMKDTCCDPGLIERRIRITKGTPMKLYNANTATLLGSLRAGAAGYCGIMANFHPDLYARLMAYHLKNDAKADELSAWLGLMSGTEGIGYPLSAKHHFNHIGLPMQVSTRVPNLQPLRAYEMKIMDDMAMCEAVLRRQTK